MSRAVSIALKLQLRGNPHPQPAPGVLATEALASLAMAASPRLHSGFKLPSSHLDSLFLPEVTGGTFGSSCKEEALL